MEKGFRSWLGLRAPRRAYLKDNNVNEALSKMDRRCAICVRRLAGNPRYLSAQAAYSEALKSAGMRTATVETKAHAEQKLKLFYGEQCTQCRSPRWLCINMICQMVLGVPQSHLLWASAHELSKGIFMRQVASPAY
jgi:hypothetical protein